MCRKAFWLLCILVAHSSFYAADGSLDATFNGTGRVVTNFGNSEQAFALAIQTDGKIVAAGRTGVAGALNFALTRYNTDGSLDTTFGTSGFVITDVGGSDEQINGIVLQPNGKIVVAGYSNASGNNDFALARYNTNGTLDTTFGTSGLVRTTFSVGSNDVASAVILQPDGKIIAAGTSNASGNNDFALARYNTDGTLDTTFGTSGLVMTTFSVGSIDAASAVILQPDGKIIAAGTSNALGNNDFALARYNTNGTLDTTFGTNGLVITSIGNIDNGRAVQLQCNGKIVMAGYSNVNGSDDFTVVRYNANGLLDTTFGINGIVVTTISGADQLWCLVIQPNSKIIAGGQASNMFALVRYNAEGSLDSTFGTDGIVTTNFPSTNNDWGRAIALQSDGKIVLAGIVGAANAFDFGLARYLNDEFNVVGSDTTLSLFTTPQFVSDNGRFAKLALLENGFALCGNGTFDSCFPVVGTICLNCNTLTLQKDLIMGNIGYLGSLGDIVGNGHVLDLAQSVTTLPNAVCTDLAMLSIASCPNVEWGNITVSLNSDITLQDTTITFTGISTLIGNNNMITLDSNSAIIVGADAQLTLQNITIAGVNGTKIQGISDQSHLILENATWILDGNYTFAAGYFDVVRDFYIIGQNYQFNYQTTQASTITTDSRFMIGRDITFRYSPAMASKDLLLFADDSAQLVLKGGTFRASSTGVNLLKGMVRILNRSTLLGEGINTAQAISLGDSISSNHLTMQINPAAQLVVEGSVVYNDT